MYDRSRGLLFSLFMGGRRQMYNLANELHRLGELRGKTIGILTDQRPGQAATTAQLQQALNSLGYEVAYTASLDNDLSTGASRVPIEVQQMQTRGVDAVIMIASIVYANQFAQTAHNQRYYPSYYVTDWQNATTDTYGQPMPDSYDGAVAITATRVNHHRTGAPEPEDAVACRRIYESRAGQRLTRGDAYYGAVMRTCALAQIFEAGAKAAGTDLTRTRFSQATANLGALYLGDLAPGSLTPGKPDAAEQ
jgi:ABC-type branched-subunit amino acid transport system substrate-binding protein